MGKVKTIVESLKGLVEEDKKPTDHDISQGIYALWLLFAKDGEEAHIAEKEYREIMRRLGDPADFKAFHDLVTARNFAEACKMLAKTTLGGLTRSEVMHKVDTWLGDFVQDDEWENAPDGKTPKQVRNDYRKGIVNQYGAVFGR